VGAVAEICNKTWEIWDPEEAALVEVEKVSKQPIYRLAETLYDKLPKDEIGRASCRERVCYSV
jgi:hypothetical protein